MKTLKQKIKSLAVCALVACGAVPAFAEEGRFKLDLHEDIRPEGGVTVVAEPAPDEGDGLYAEGTVVTLTAMDGTNVNWGAFGAWAGDVGNKRRWSDDRTISVTMDADKSIYCEQKWYLSGSTLFDGYHSISMTVSGKSVTLKIDGAKATPVYPVLDLRKPIANGYTLTGIADYGTRGTSFRTLYLPETMTWLGGNQSFGNFSFIWPCLPEAVTSLGSQAMNGAKHTGCARIMSTLAAMILPSQIFYNSSFRQFVYGPSLIQIAANVFQSSGAPHRTMKFYGGVPSFESNSNNDVSEGKLRLFVDPLANPSWQDYIDTCCRVATETDVTNYRNTFGDDGTAPQYVTTASIPGSTVWAKKQYVVLWRPYLDDVSFTVEGSPTRCPVAVRPNYGICYDYEIGETVNCSAPETTIAEDGSKYVCKGYVYEKMDADGNWVEVSSGEGNAFTFTQAVGHYRLTWQWETTGRYRIDLHEDIRPEGGVTVTADPEPDEDGCYESGTVVTLTAQDGANANWGAFGAWTGDLDASCRWSDQRTIAVTMNGNKSIYCEQKWYCNGSSSLYDGYHTVLVDVSGKNVSFKIDGAKCTVRYPVLDLRKPIANGYSLVSVNAYATRNSSFKTLYLPETLKTFGGNQYVSGYTFIWPCLPESVTSIGSTALSSVGFTGTLYLMNDALSALPNQVCNGASLKRYVFGPSIKTVGDNFFQNLNGLSRTICFYGEAPKFGAASNGADSYRRHIFVDPTANPGWQDFVTNSCRAPTANELLTYAKNFGTDTTPQYVTTANIPSNSIWKTQFLSTWRPYVDDVALVIDGEPERCPAEISPAYGSYRTFAIGEKVNCVAPQRYMASDGAVYTCRGYRLDKREADGSWTEVASDTATSYEFTQAKGWYRLTWLWKLGGRYKLELHQDIQPEGAATITAVPEPGEDGCYERDTVVTLTAVDGTAEGWGAFGAWHGDVGTDNRWTNQRTITITMDANKDVYCEQVWSFANNKLTDGYWTLGCSANASKEITINSDCVQTKGGVPMIDLKKPVSGGYKIVQLNAYAFRSSKAGTYKTFYFPDTVKTINSGGDSMFGGSGVSSVYNTFPNCLKTFGGGLGGVTHGFKGDPAIKLLNKNLTTFPGQLFSGKDGGRTYHLGIGFKTFSNYAFDGGGGNNSVYFYGETKPTVGTGWMRGITTMRFVVPKTSADWKAWIAAGNVTPATDASTKTYNSTFPKQEPGEKFIGVCKNVDGLNGVYLCTWPSPAAKQFKILLR